MGRSEASPHPRYRLERTKAGLSWTSEGGEEEHVLGFSVTGA